MHTNEPANPGIDTLAARIARELDRETPYASEGMARQHADACRDLLKRAEADPLIECIVRDLVNEAPVLAARMHARIAILMEYVETLKRSAELLKRTEPVIIEAPHPHP